ncbi:hypothetical protein D0Y65_026253 [Glycine soja]|uniref:Uncharacterized protein n=1 Tax=Glycine soja TaxID=3848 RepID=A0A445IJ81_GLYSO|nr:hypothetical protein D0Y65_026253 [Glycine soja]
MILTGKGPALGSLWVANLPLKVGLKLMLMYQLVLEDTLLLVEVFSGILKFAWHNNIKKLWIESDSAISVHLITSQGKNVMDVCQYSESSGANPSPQKLK